MNRVVLRTRGLTKRFGDVLAVDNLDLEIREGEVLGFLGPNGSGKSTTVSMLLGLIRPTSGVIERNELTLSSIGAIIEFPAFYPYLSGRDNLRALALVTDIPSAKRIDELLELVGLAAAGGRKVQAYSLGMKQRLGIASTLLGNPRLVILDEPTNGLDPAGQQEVRALIPRLAEEGRSVLLASHVLHEVEQVCDRVAILRKGKLVAEGPVRELVKRGAFLEIRVDDLNAAMRVLKAQDFVRSVRIDDGSLHVEASADQAAAIARKLAEHEIYPSSLTEKQSTLEDVFLDITTEHDPG